MFKKSGRSKVQGGDIPGGVGVTGVGVADAGRLRLRLRLQLTTAAAHMEYARRTGATATKIDG